MVAEKLRVTRKAGNLRERLQARTRAEKSKIRPEDRERSSITGRLEKLPPLKRAVVWAEILGPPGGRQ
jgi:hypothetical protein